MVEIDKRIAVHKSIRKGLIFFVSILLGIVFCCFGCAGRVNSLDNEDDNKTMINNGPDDYKSEVSNELDLYISNACYDIKNKNVVDTAIYEFRDAVRMAKTKQEVDTAINTAKEKINNVTIAENEKRQISYEYQTYYGMITGEYECRVIIRSYSEWEDFLSTNNISKDDKKYSRYDLQQYDIEYFNDNALVICSCRVEDFGITRRVESVNIVDNTLLIDEMNIFYNNTVNCVEACLLNIIQVNMFDIVDITDIAIRFKYTEQK